jgi:hypothetical protein
MFIAAQKNIFTKYIIFIQTYGELHEIILNFVGSQLSHSIDIHRLFFNHFNLRIEEITSRKMNSS